MWSVAVVPVAPVAAVLGTTAKRAVPVFRVKVTQAALVAAAPPTAMPLVAEAARTALVGQAALVAGIPSAVPEALLELTVTQMGPPALLVSESGLVEAAEVMAAPIRGPEQRAGRAAETAAPASLAAVPLLPPTAEAEAEEASTQAARAVRAVLAA